MLSGSYSNKKYEDNILEGQESFYLPQNTIYRDTKMEDSRFKNDQQYAMLKVSNRTDKRLLSGEVTFVRDHLPANNNQTSLDYRTSHVSSAEWQKQENLQPSVTLHANFNLPKKQILEFSLGGTYSNNGYQRNYQENSNQSFTNVNEDMYTYSFSGNYVVPFKHNNSLNIYALHHHEITSSLYSGDYNSWQHL